MSRVTITHLSLTFQGDVDARNEAARRIVLLARLEANRSGVQVSISTEEEIVDDRAASSSGAPTNGGRDG